MELFERVRGVRQLLRTCFPGNLRHVNRTLLLFMETGSSFDPPLG